jgi:hypothetical protein
MSVVNVKVANIRPKYNNLEEWCNDSTNVYIGRKGIVFIDGVRYPKKDSFWCNPYKIDKNNNRDNVLFLYEKYLTEELSNDKNFIKELAKLKGKKLGCWCKPEQCHGDILLKFINQLSNTQTI